MILENAFYTVIRLTFGKSVQDCTAPPSSQSLFGASKTLMKNHFYQTQRQLLVFFFSWTHLMELPKVPPFRRCGGDASKEADRAGSTALQT